MEDSLQDKSKGDGLDVSPKRDTAGDLKQQAGDLAEQAKARAVDAAQSGQSAAADQLEHLAQGVRRSMDNFEGESAWLKSGLGTAAENLERFSTTLRDRDIHDLLQDAEAVARRHPVMFAAACAASGFAIMRFLKSSRQDGVRDSGSASRTGHYPGDTAVH